MKRFLSVIAISTAAASACFAADSSPLWLRDVAISPDGSTIAFTYQGDIFTIPVSGGQARQITSNAAFDASPVWNPSGTKIAFRSDREGSDDIFIVDARGGTPVRLTTSSGAEIPMTFLDESTLLFRTSGMPAPGSMRAPFYTQTYSIDTNNSGKRPKLFLSVPMLSASANAKGQILYTDRKSPEDELRKHEHSSGTKDVWLYSDGAYRALTDFNGQDNSPVWGSKPGEFFYISEQDGTLNVWEGNIDNGTRKQLTHFTKHPVRTLSAASDGTLAFSWDGEIYTLKPGQQPQRLNVEITADNYDSDLVKRTMRNGFSNATVSPDGSQVAIVIRGDIYVTDTKYKTTRRITDTPAQERVVSFSPDGKKLVYDSDRDGIWQLFIASIADKDGKSFAYAEDIKEEPLYRTTLSAQQPVFSPDGKKVAFLEDRCIIKVIDVASKKVTTALPGDFNYSYSDGDIEFAWSPDSKWLLASYMGEGGWNNRDVAIVKADGTEVIDLTESGYTDSNPRWVMDGKAITYESSRYGMRSHGSWGEQTDVMFMALDPEAWDDMNLTEEEAALKEKAAKEKKEADKKAQEAASKDKKGKAKAEVKKETAPAVDFDLEGRRHRTMRLTPSSGNYNDHFLSPKGDKLYYLTRATEGGMNLYVRDLKKGETTVLSKGVGFGMMPDAKGENLFVGGSNGIKKINLSTGKAENVEFEAFYDRHPSLEREYMYDHMLHQVRDKFYDEKLHGVDWEGYGKHYRKFLPYINNNRDFATLLSEILGELNASHTGGRARTAGAQMPTAALGVFYDDSYKGEGARIAEVISGGPLSTKRASVKPGDIILAIDGKKIEPEADFNYMLDGKAGKRVRLSIASPDGTTRSINVRPISAGQQSDLLYTRWTERNAHIVDSLSGGRIGYVHIQGMNSPSFRHAYDRLLGKYRNCDAVVVDTRYNGGGWLHNDIVLLLGGKEYVQFRPRGRYIGSEPFSQWHKPSVMLVNEANYSDAHGTPAAYKVLGIGELVGAPVPGTMTAVWWENQIDPSIVFGIPQVTNADMNGEAFENKQLNPDVLIFNNPADLDKGKDAQLEGAVKRLLDKLPAKTSKK